MNLKKAIEKDPKDDIPILSSDKIRIYHSNELVGQRYVTLSGYVKNAGKYVLRKGMRINDLVFSDLGMLDDEFKKQVYMKRADLIRFGKDKIQKQIIPFNLSTILGNKESSQNIELIPGDEIRIYSKKIFDFLDTITINGFVNNPGTYLYKTDMTLKDLIFEAKGFKNKYNSYRVDVARLNRDSLKKELFSNIFTYNIDSSFNLTNIERNGTLLLKENSILLQPYDVISIRKSLKDNKQKSVMIEGEVTFPGLYIIEKSDEKVSDVIKKAGGLKPNAYPLASRFIRSDVEIKLDIGQILKKRKSIHDFIVHDGDIIRISEKPNIIEIVGEVNNPGFYKFNKGSKVSDEIKRAGGLSSKADPASIFIKYPDGNARKYSNWFYGNVKVKDGSQIIIGKVKEKEPFNITEFLTDFSSIIANVAQVITIVVLAKN